MSLHLREAVAQLSTDAEAARAAMSVAKIVDGLDQHAEVGGEFTRGQDRFQAREWVRCLTHAKQVRQPSRATSRKGEAHLGQR